VDIQYHSNSKLLEVFMDGDQGIGIDQCAKLNRYLQGHLDEGGWIGDDYTLEISSPGIGTPLKLKRQYHKNIGRTLAVELTDDHVAVKGILSEVKDDAIVISYEAKVPVEEGKKKKHLVTLKQEIPFERIKKAVIKIVFN
jgi:ribosome maturation factor RimP